MGLLNKLYHVSVSAGRFVGCHQRPDRSFFIHGNQFPVCARCTGVFAGECFGVIFFRTITPPTTLLLTFCGIMFLDWLIQFLKIRESTNRRRLITGTLGGYAYATLLLKCLVWLKQII